ncbi:hypothetical protein DSO57_1021864 [Entomophthora muscae]|uniref:Uncharacterized protein n=1 Tax=Entomophthora muscae TaxID=34485 RepID=A0ACC2RUF4_9FUNG|nr:hypothetical protein DSO57_1021864 [Entomophthora muscae]
MQNIFSCTTWGIYIATYYLEVESFLRETISKEKNSIDFTQTYCYNCNMFKTPKGILPTTIFQVGASGSGAASTPAPKFPSKSKYSGAGINYAAPTAMGPVMGPKSCVQALMSIAGTGQTSFSYPVPPI